MAVTNQASTYDAVIVGSGPNGLAAGIRLALEGLSVKIFEAADTIGGGMRTSELMKTGFKHDICSAIHPVAASSPFLKQLPLDKHGLQWVHPIHPAAHPLDGENTIIQYSDLEEMTFHLESDGNQYKEIVKPLLENWDELTRDFLGPLRYPDNPMQMASFGLKALQPASMFQTRFKLERTKALFAGMVAHSMLPLDYWSTTAIGLVFWGTAHTGGWPMPKGGSQSLADAMARYFKSLGGTIETGCEIKRVQQLPKTKAVLFDLTPLQILRIVAGDFPLEYRRKLNKFRYGPGAFKIDYILKEPVPWRDYECRRAGTVHLGGTFNEIAEAENRTNQGHHPDRPFVLVAQQSLFDSTRTPDDKHTLWAYCHVPNGSVTDMTEAIENQIERFAPGFKDIIDEKSTMNTADFLQYNANYIGGDINGGKQNLGQLFKRPTNIINPYKTPAKGIYICSSSTPPGGGVHGMCGFHAANAVLKKEFGIKKSDWKFKY